MHTADLKSVLPCKIVRTRISVRACLCVYVASGEGQSVAHYEYRCRNRLDCAEKG
jgi:hypothetical protein